MADRHHTRQSQAEHSSDVLGHEPGRLAVAARGRVGVARHQQVRPPVASRAKIDDALPQAAISVWKSLQTSGSFTRAARPKQRHSSAHIWHHKLLRCLVVPAALHIQESKWPHAPCPRTFDDAWNHELRTE